MQRNTWFYFLPRLNYSLTEPLFIPRSMRWDGSSQFSSDNRWNFPSSLALNGRWKKKLPEKRELPFPIWNFVFGLGTSPDIGWWWLCFPTFLPTSDDYKLLLFGGPLITVLVIWGFQHQIWNGKNNYWNGGLVFGFLNGRISGAIDGYYRETGTYWTVSRFHLWN